MIHQSLIPFMNRKEKTLLFILACINFTNIMDFMIMMPLQEFLAPVFKISPRQFSYLVSTYAFSAFFSSLTASFFADRFDRKYNLLFAYIGFVVGTLACAFAPTYQMLMLARIMAGLFGGLIGAQVLSIIGDTFPYERRGRAMGIIVSAFSFAAVAGVPSGLFLATKFGWHIPFLGIGILGIIIIPLIFFIVPNITTHLSKTSSNLAVYHSILGSRNQQYGLLMMFTLILSHFSIIPFIAPFLEKNVGFTKNQITLMYFIGGAVTLYSSPRIGRMADKIGKHKIFSIFLLLSIIPIFLITNMPRIPFYYVLMATALFFIIAGGRMVPAQALIVSVVPPNLRGGFMNLNSSLQQLGTGMAAFIAGAIVTKNSADELQHFEIVGYIGIVITILCFVIAQKVKPIDKH